ncbi:MAG: HEAT repeat domain-containing protein, partial [Chloroflexi bacterium]|nr:HEAT repeat domain-containing protein [Chloroflexota bacterium]
RAVETLRHIDDPRAQERLSALLDDPAAGAYLVYRAIRALRWLNPLHLLEAGQRQVRRADGLASRGLEALRHFHDDPQVAALLTTLMTTHPLVEVRAEAVNIYRLRPRPEQFEAFMAALTDDGVSVRANAAWALGELGDARALPALLSGLEAEENAGWYAQSSFIRALAKLRAPQAADAILRSLADPDAININLLNHAIIGAGELGDPRAVEPLAQLMATTTDPDLLVFIVEALGRLADPRAVPALAQLLDRLTPPLEWTRPFEDALMLLGRLGDDSVRPVLARHLEEQSFAALDREDRLALQAAAAVGLAGLGEVHHLRTLVDVAEALGWRFANLDEEGPYWNITHGLNALDAEPLLAAFGALLPELSPALRVRTLHIVSALAAEGAFAFVVHAARADPALLPGALPVLEEAFGTAAASAVADHLGGSL